MLTLMFHGGFLMMPFVLLAVYYGVRLVVNKDIKDFGWGCLTALVCFISTLITSYGRSCWTYSNKQSMYPEIRNNISEWMSMDWGIELFIPCLLILIGLIMDKRFRDKDADHLCKIAYYCAFFVGACIYCRLFILQGVFFLLFGPKALDNLIMFCKELFSFNRVKTSTKLNIKSNKIKFKLKDTTKQNIALIMCCILFGALLCVNIAFFMDFKDNTVNDTAVVDGYDTELIDFIKDNGYEKIYNDYTIGTWLLFNDIKVHIDNRLDPYLKSYSGVDTIHNSMYINNLIHMNDFRDKYHPDVFIFHSQDATDKIEAGEQYEHLNNMENFFEMIDTYESDRYKKVYDSTTYSVDKLTHEKTKSSHKHHWVVYECIY